MGAVIANEFVGPAMTDREFTVRPIGRIEADVEEARAGQVESLRGRPARIVVAEVYDEALFAFDERVGTVDEPGYAEGLIDVIFLLDRVEEEDVELRGWSGEGLTPAGERGVFTSRTPARPNRLGVTTVRVRERDGLTLVVEGLDAVDGTPVLDVKPHVDWREKLGTDG